MSARHYKTRALRRSYELTLYFVKSNGASVIWACVTCACIDSCFPQIRRTCFAVFEESHSGSHVSKHHRTPLPTCIGPRRHAPQSLTFQVRAVFRIFLAAIMVPQQDARALSSRACQERNEDAPRLQLVCSRGLRSYRRRAKRCSEDPLCRRTTIPTMQTKTSCTIRSGPGSRLRTTFSG